jgi:hypothetical protein
VTGSDDHAVITGARAVQSFSLAAAGKVRFFVSCCDEAATRNGTIDKAFFLNDCGQAAIIQENYTNSFSLFAAAKLPQTTKRRYR